MYANQYTRERAEHLVPMLRSIAREIDERTRAIGQLESLLEAPASEMAIDPRSTGLAGLAGGLANQRRELRLAKQELNRFGCSLDDDHPLRILIPGEDGTLASGYAWNPGDESLRSTEVRIAS